MVPQAFQLPPGGPDGLPGHVRLAVAELDRLVEKCVAIEDLLGGLAGKLAPEDLAKAQRMDELTQIVRGVQQYLSLAEMSAHSGRPLDRDRIVDAIRPRDLAQRLAGGDPGLADAPEGDVELF